MENGTLYVGLDSTQYSNGLYKEGNRREICVAVFSFSPECLFKKRCTKRDFSILEELLNDRNSASMTLGPKEVPVDASPLIYSAAQLTSFYIENAAKKFERVEMHIDGPLHVKDKKYLRGVLGAYGPVVIENHRRCYNKNRHAKRKGKNPESYTQPKIVLAADALSNYLFRKKGLGLFPDLDSRKVRIIKLQVNGLLVEHYVLST